MLQNRFNMNRACFSESTNLHENIDMRAPSDLLKSNYLRMKQIKSRILIFLFIISFYIPLNSQTNSDGTSPQFLFPDFYMSKVRMKNGQSQSVTCLLYTSPSPRDG